MKTVLLIGILLLAACSEPESESTENNPNATDPDNANENDAVDNLEDENNLEEEPAAVAEVNGELIDEQTFHEALREQYGENVLQVLIQEKVFEKEAEELGITEEEVQAEISYLMDTMGIEEEEEFYTMMEMQGVQSESELRKRVLQHLVMQEMTGHDGEFSEEDLREEYDRGAELTARHILTGDRETAEEVLDQLEEGESFADLAESYSQDPGSSSEGGELGTFGRGTMTPPFEAAAFLLEDGEYSEPVQSQFGYHVIEVTDRTPFDEPFEEVQDQLQQSLSDRYQYQVNRIQESMMDEADVTILDEDFQSISDDQP
ncbi:peptidylprolyl isomerase [Alkalicoccus luteus]|uniref:peptidylprolyl isomerase n=1 Tax=Alkalicoccus luteus TaxID=1237094 RepID=UPI0040336E43